VATHGMRKDKGRAHVSDDVEGFLKHVQVVVDPLTP
jgi:hypothetical protein